MGGEGAATGRRSLESREGGAPDGGATTPSASGHERGEPDRLQLPEALMSAVIHPDRSYLIQA